MPRFTDPYLVLGSARVELWGGSTPLSREEPQIAWVLLGLSLVFSLASAVYG